MQKIKLPNNNIKEVASDIELNPYEYEDAMEYEERLKQLLKRKKEKTLILK